MAEAGQPGLKLQQDIAAAGVTDLNSSNMRLFTNAPTITINSAIADFVEPTFTGYTAQAIGTGVQSMNANTDLIEKWPSAVFSTGALPASPVQVNGYFIEKTITAVDHLLFAEYFDTPLIFQFFPQAYEVVFEWIIPNIKNYGGYCSVC